VTQLPSAAPPRASAEAAAVRKRALQASLKLATTGQRVSEATAAEEFIVVLGWNNAIGALLVEMDHVVARGSEVVVYSPRAVAEREQFIKASQIRRGYQYRNITVSHQQGKLGARYMLEGLPLEKTNRIFILAENSAASAWEADGQTIAVILQVRDILQMRALEALQVERRSIIPQILDRSAEDAIRHSGLYDCIDSSTLAARVLASICETPALGSVLQAILSEEGARFCIRELRDFLASRGSPSSSSDAAGGGSEEGTSDDSDKDSDLEVSFDEVTAAASSAGEVALGWTEVGGDGNWELNPKDKATRRRWTSECRVVTLAPSRQTPDPTIDRSSPRLRSWSARPSVMMFPPTPKKSGDRRLAWTGTRARTHCELPHFESEGSIDQTPRSQPELQTVSTCAF